MTDGQQEQLEQFLAASVFTIVRALIRAGMEPGQAFRFAPVVVIEGGMGRAALREAGVPESTERRWRGEARKALDGLTPSEEVPAELLEDLKRVTQPGRRGGRPLRP